jgi:hypothetical protein
MSAAHDMYPGTVPYEAIENWAKAGEEWASRNAAANILEETRKVVLARYTAEYVPASKSYADAERQALADGRYLEHLQAMVAAREVADIAKVHAECARAEFERRRTNASTLRDVSRSL